MFFGAVSLTPGITLWANSSPQGYSVHTFIETIKPLCPPPRPLSHAGRGVAVMSHNLVFDRFPFSQIGV
jgi:hypothetical protein